MWGTPGACDVGLAEDQPLNLGGFPEQMGLKEGFFSFFLFLFFVFWGFLEKKRRGFMFLLGKLF